GSGGGRGAARRGADAGAGQEPAAGAPAEREGPPVTTLDASRKPPLRLPFVAADWTAPGDLSALQQKALIAGAVGAVASLLGLFLNAPVFFRAYLVAWLLVVALAVGSLAIAMLHHLSRGAWGLMVRRPLEAAGRTIPLVAILGIPILLGLRQIYPWAQ